MISERKESGFYLPKGLEGERPGLGVQLLSAAGFAWELKVRALLLVVFFFIPGCHGVMAGDKHKLKSTFF